MSAGNFPLLELLIETMEQVVASNLDFRMDDFYLVPSSHYGEAQGPRPCRIPLPCPSCDAYDKVCCHQLQRYSD